MPRRARLKSSTGIYHIVVRGINKSRIFNDDYDRKMFLFILKQVSAMCSFKLLAYCLMDTHVHLLIQENDKIAAIMHRLLTRYAHWFNGKYDRIGHLFQDRYLSRCVETERYLLVVLRYIHQNPIKANMSFGLEYKWSSHLDYIGNQNRSFPKVDIDFIFSFLSEDSAQALQMYMEFMNEFDKKHCLDYDSGVTDDWLREEILQVLKGQPIESLLSMPRKQRRLIIKEIKVIDGVTIRQIARVTGLNKSTVFRA